MSVIIISNAGGGGGGMVNSVTAGDLSIVVGGTAANPTIETGTLDEIATLHPPVAAVAMNGQKITGLANGSGAQDAVAFGQLASYAPLASPALTGTPTAPTKAALTNNTDIATTAYTDAAVAVETSRAETAEALALPKTGGTMSGVIAMGANKITGVANGSASTDAAAFGQTPAGGAIVSGQFLCAPSVYAPATLTQPAVTTTTMAAYNSGVICTGSFTAPPSGSVVVHVSLVANASSGAGRVGWGLAAVGTVTPLVGNAVSPIAGSSSPVAYSIRFIVTGLTPGTSYNFDLLGCITSADTFTISAQGQNSTALAANSGGPVIITTQAV
jgi:hypothetical protein